MFYTETKLKNRIEELEKYRYINRQPLKNLKFKEDTTKEEKYPPKVDSTWQDVRMGSYWEGRDLYLWLITQLTVPQLNKGEELVLLFDIGKTGAGHNSGFESLLFIDGVPNQGVDSNHKEVFLPDSYSGKKIEIALKLWSGLEGGGKQQIIYNQFLYADYAILCPEADNLYYTAKNMLEAVAYLEETNSDRYILLNLLEDTFKIIDWAQPVSKNFYTSIKEANAYLDSQLVSVQKNTPITVTAVGHTHIDVAWLWRLKHTREKIARSFSTVLKLMERYPEYVFLQSQPQVYKYIKQDYPEIYEKLKAKIKSGEWEIDGGMWVEADCNIPNGESLVRQLLYGSKFMQEEFGVNPAFLWLPDVFGYSWALPQILKKSGIKTFMTTKISWNQYNRIPHDTFVWRGIDGTEILTHFITTPDMGDAIHYTYNGPMDPRAVTGIYKNYRNKDFNSNLLLAYGHGDGGGGVTRDMLENRRKMDKIPGLPNVKTGKARDFFNKLNDTVNNTTNYVHTWDGELYLEYHRGTYTSQAATKKHNRKLELAYRDAELLHTLALCTNKDWQYPAKAIKDGWEIILRNQFHDIIPGSSINEVYKDAEVEYQEAEAIAKNMFNEFSQGFVNNGKGVYTIFNTAGFDRSEIVTIEGNQVMVDVKALSSVVIDPHANSIKNNDKPPFKLTENAIDTPIYKIQWGKGGQLTSIYDKQNDRQVLSGEGNQLQLFEDKPMNFDAWDIDLFYYQKKKTLNACEIKSGAITPLVAEVLFTYKFGESTIVQKMLVYTNNRRIDFVTEVDWQERQQLLKANFDVNIRATIATYDIQYGNVKRSTHWNTSWDMAKFESVAHKWVDFAERDYGVALLNDSKYGHSVKDKTMSISLLKGAIYPDPFADIGRHNFTYSLLPHKGDFVAGNVANEAWSINCPLTVFKGDAGCKTYFEIESEYPVAIDAIKKTEDNKGIAIRLHDHTGSTRKVKMMPNFPFTNWEEVDLMENPSADSNAGAKTGDIVLELAPYEIKTILVSR